MISPNWRKGSKRTTVKKVRKPESIWIYCMIYNSQYYFELNSVWYLMYAGLWKYCIFTVLIGISPGRMHSVPAGPSVSKNRAQALNCQSVMGSLYRVRVYRKLRISLSDLSNVTSCYHFEIVKLGIVQKANLIPLWRMDPHSCSGWEHLRRRTLHSFTWEICPFFPIYWLIQSVIYIIIYSWTFTLYFGLQSRTILFIFFLRFLQLWLLGTLSVSACVPLSYYHPCGVFLFLITFLLSVTTKFFRLISYISYLISKISISLKRLGSFDWRIVLETKIFIILSEVSQTEEDKYHMISLMI